MLDMIQYGFPRDRLPPETGIFERSAPDGALPGRVTAVHRDRYEAVCPHGEVSCVLKGALLNSLESHELPTVGDYVHLLYNDSGPSLVTEVLPRRTKFSRTDFSGHAAGYAKTILEQVVAANFDTVFIVSSLNRDFKASRIDRYLTAARNSGGAPVVVLTKADLCAPPEDGDSGDAPGFTPEEALAAVNRIAPHVPAFAVSSLTGAGLDRLEPFLGPGQTVVFLGMSGVGKSSLLNALAGRDVMAVKSIREDDSRGRHTTTHRQMILLPSGALVIDTPGMRELGLWDAGEGIGAAFAQIETLFPLCRFSDCRHESEPGCAVKAALENGRLTQEDWDRYLSQRQEARFVEDKAAFQRERDKWHKSLSKQIRQMKKDRR